MNDPAPDLPALEPVATLLRRVREELGGGFDPTRPVRVSRAPGRLDVMGGIADYTGSMVLQATLDRAAAVALQTRSDRQLQIFSFNLLDEHRPFTLQIPVEALTASSPAILRQEFAQPGRQWAAYVAGCLLLLHQSGDIDLTDPAVPGLNLAVYSTVPMGAGVSSSAAIEVATMTNLVGHFGLGDRFDPLRLAALCQRVENELVGAPCGIMDQVGSCFGQAGSLLRMVCQPHEILPPLRLPAGTRVIGISSGVRHTVGGGQYGKTRCAAFMGHAMILHRMRELGRRAGRDLSADPMNGYLANLDPDDYKKLFRQTLPEQIAGRDFLASFGPTIDRATAVDADTSYSVLGATDHHVLEARRVRRFAEFIQQASESDRPRRNRTLDRAGHLMYASHHSYTHDALLGDDACDVLVRLVRDRESAGFYGAKITGGGCGGTVAVLAETSEAVDKAVDEIMAIYAEKTGNVPEAFTGTSPGAWHVGTATVG